MTSPLVSVVMPAYGHERFVGAAIESVLAQTIPDWELIVIDDASPDGTWGEIGRFRDSRLIAARHEFNRGAHATLNEGIARARGRHVAILNSDDVYHAARLERLVGYLEANDLDLVGSEVRLIDASGAPIDEEGHDWIAWYRGLLDMLEDGTDIADALLGGNVFVTTSNFLFRRGLIDRVGGFANLRYAHDYAFLLAAIAQDKAAIAVLRREPLLNYRWHGSNTIREGAWEVGRETFGVLCQYFPLLLPKDLRPKLELALKHLSSLARTYPDPESGQALRLFAEIQRLGLERDRVAMEVDNLRAEVVALRASFSFRLGAALLHPMRHLRGPVTKGR